MDLLVTFFVLYFVIGYGEGRTTFNVKNFGAVGDGKTDDSQAFLKAWEALCTTSERDATLVIPAGGSFLLKPLDFKGPCKSCSVHVQVLGRIVAPSTASGWGGCGIMCWLCFHDVTGLIVGGSGEVDGQGSDWWKNVKHGCEAPLKALFFHNCKNLQLSGFNVVNSPRNHINLNYCQDVSISHLKITAPGDSPNTDGIGLTGSNQVNIADTNIATGDDCIAIKGGSSNINISHINCGPGHGISIGSLGDDGAADQVEEVHVRNCIFTGTENGARIKTMPGGTGYAKRITFDQITLDKTGNPIIIDQHYCSAKKCADQPKAVQVSDVTFTGFRGTSSDELAITLDCAKIGCRNIRLVQNDITSSVPGKQTTAVCNNAHGICSSTVPHVTCLQP